MTLLRLRALRPQIAESLHQTQFKLGLYAPKISLGGIPHPTPRNPLQTILTMEEKGKEFNLETNEEEEDLEEILVEEEEDEEMEE